MRFILVFLVLAGLLSTCKQPDIIKNIKTARGVLLKTKEVSYPSGSALIGKNGKLYLMGDDARELLVLDTAFNELERIDIFGGSLQRLSKKTKADIESIDFLNENPSRLLLIASGSVWPTRDSLFILDLKKKTIARSPIAKQFRQLLDGRKAELNIEGAAFIDSTLVLANRSNLKSKQNYLIVNKGESTSSQNSPNRLISLDIDEAAYGVSGLDYDKNRDILLLTFSSEATQSAFADGEIGNSAIGLISNISRKLERDTLTLDAWFPLSGIDKRFNKMKIESVAVDEDERKDLVLYLVSDNDDGKSTLFKISWVL